jgi:hypothetical protein
MNKQELNPNWVTGFVDGEGCFYIGLSENSKRNVGWRVDAAFAIKLHIRDKNLLLQIKLFFNNLGTIVTNKNSVSYSVRNIKEIVEVIITQKQSDFLLWKNIITLMCKNEHLNVEGLIKILSLRASLNRGFSDKLLIFFPNIVKVIKPKIITPLDIDCNWLAGFFSGEGCFHVYLGKSKRQKTGYAVHLLLYINQHSRDEFLINLFKSIFGCGYIFNHSSGNAKVFSVTKFKDIYVKIIPFFNKYKIEGIKSLDFKDFCAVAELINKGAHLTSEGIQKIKDIKSRMNSGRY